MSTPALRNPLPESELDRALDTLAQILRTLGRHAFDTDERSVADIEQRFESLAARVLVGPTLSEEQEESGAGQAQRDFASVRRVVAEQRAHEQAFVVRALGDLREALRAFAQAIAVAVTEDRAADAKLGAQVGRLVAAFGANDSASLRREAELVAELFRELAERRRERETEQISLLTDKVRTLRSELTEARNRAALDPLTRLFNRAALDEHIARVATLGLLLGSEPTLLMVDVDHFKRVNDEHGHPVGDEVLKHVADTLVRNFLRREDFVARYGGEEFVIVVTDSQLGAVKNRAERVRESIRQMDFGKLRPGLCVTVSLGLAGLKDGESAGDWLARADRALYDAKLAGRDRLVVAG